MKRVGIVSMYHNSRNYGGLLQAYALCKVLNDLGIIAEQIDVPSVTTVSNRTKRLANYGVLDIIS